MSMKIRFDVGTPDGLPCNLIGLALNVICRDMEKLHNVQSAKCTAYLQFYDKDGVPQDIGDKHGKLLSYTLRSQPYKRKPKNAVLCGDFHGKQGDMYMYYMFKK